MRTQYHARAIHFHDKIGVSRIISVLGSLTFGAIHSALTDIRSTLVKNARNVATTVANQNERMSTPSEDHTCLVT